MTAPKHLRIRNGNYQYYRRVPARFKEIDSRGGFIQQSLKTNDLGIALSRRDKLDIANEAYWSGLLRKDKDGLLRYQAACDLALSHGLTYRPESEIVEQETTQALLNRIEVAKLGNPAVVTAALGLVGKPKLKVSQAFKYYVEVIEKIEQRNKSDEQYKSWLKVKTRAVNNFIKVVSDKPILEINRDDALLFHKHWANRILSRAVKSTTGNRDMGNMRVLVREYAKHIGIDEFKNPFANLNFAENDKGKRAAFEIGFLRDRILSPIVLNKLNKQARDIFLTMVDAGCRPSEIANLTNNEIFLECEVPYIRITPVENEREIKTDSSKRRVPLVGLALKAMQDNPEGFPNYIGKGNGLSAVLMGWLKTNNLLPTKEHKAYSVRHTFEDRMKEAGLDYDIRRYFMGHKVDRPEYGEGGSLKWQQSQLQKIVW